MPDKELKYIASQTAFQESHGDIDVTTGDDRNELFQEQVKLRYNRGGSNRYSISSRLVMDNIFDREIGQKTITEIDGKIISSCDIIKNEYFDIEAGKEHLTTLFAKPKTNELQYKFKLKGCELSHQPPLTDEYQAGWSKRFSCEIDVTETQVIDTKTGNILISRPPDVVNSHAIYNNQGDANHIINPFTGYDANFCGGKIGHLMRKKAILPDGREIWLKSVFDKDILTVTLPDELLKDESLFQKGLIVHPTFGYTTAPATKTAYGDGDTTAFKAALSEAGTATSITQYLDKGTGTPCYVKMGIYADSSDYPGALIVSTAQLELTTDDSWRTGSIADTSLSAADYWIASLDVFGNIGANYFYDANASYKTYNDNASNTDLPANYAASQTLLQRVCGFYVTYTAGSASAFKQRTYFIQ